MSRGKDSDDPIEIVLLDVKTGSAGLNGFQRRIEAAVAGKRISFDVLRINESGASDVAPAGEGTQQLKLRAYPGVHISR